MGDIRVRFPVTLCTKSELTCSSKLFLYSSAASAGLSIPYPSISLHAIQTLPTTASEPAPTPSQGVYMQLMATGDITMQDTGDEDDIEPESISLTIVPTASAPPQGPGSSTANATATQAADVIESEAEPEQTPAQALFNALSNCSNLHPDPVEDEDEDGAQGSRLIQSGLAIPLGSDGTGLPPPMPGSGGWITAENMHEFVDENGNWIEDAGEQVEDDAPLGPGAGTVRTRDGDEEDDGPVDGDESKWQRTG
jgi:chloride channel, nucleotide-sensitive, 1A